MTFSPPVAALGGALLAAAVFALVVRPAALTVHPASEAVAARVAVVSPEPAVQPPPVRVRALVYVAGAVVHPGVYAVAGDARARDALAQAGGATSDADLVAVNLAAHIADGDEIAVPHHGDVPAAAAHAPHPRARGAAVRHRRRPRRTPANLAVDAPAGNPAATLIDVNSAAADTLADLPGIGPELAERIVAFRTLNGPFASVDGLADVAGITPQRLDELELLVTTR